jgi:hypothetical protein
VFVLVLLCSTGLATAGFAQGTFTVPGTAGPTNAVNTGIVYAVGDGLIVTATGLVGWTSGAGNLTDPDGIPVGSTSCGTPPAGYWTQDACRVQLVGRIGSTVFPLGSSVSIPAPAAGVLELGVNDDYYFDNTGSFEVVVEAPVATDARSWGTIKALFE